MMQSILITGASGFLGGRAAEYFTKLGWKVLAPTRAELDFTDEKSTRAFFEKFRPDAVLHAGAMSDVGECEREAEKSYRVNVLGSENIAKACAQYGAKLLFCSSDQVYAGALGNAPHVESEALSPGNVYGCEKLEAEGKCLALCKNAVCLRLTWMYDEEREGLKTSRNFWIQLRESARAGTAMTVFTNNMRGVTNVCDVVAALPAALRLEGGVYNFGSACVGSYESFVKAALVLAGGKKEQVLVKENRAPRNLNISMKKLSDVGIDFVSAEEAIAIQISRFL